MEEIVVTSVGAARIENCCEALFVEQAVAFVMDATHAFEYSVEAVPVSDPDEANSDVRFNAPKAAFLDGRVSERIAELKCHGGEADETFTPTCDASDTMKTEGAAHERMSGLSRVLAAALAMLSRRCGLASIRFTNVPDWRVQPAIGKGTTQPWGASRPKAHRLS